LDSLEEWLSSLEGYFSVHNLFDMENIRSHSLRLSPMSNIGGKLIRSKVPQRCLEYMGPSQYMTWTTLWQERGQAVTDFTNTFHTLCTKLGTKDFEPNLVLKYRRAVHKYIQTKRDFLDVSSVSVSY
jgi:hypothetical protein